MRCNIWNLATKYIVNIWKMLCYIEYLLSIFKRINTEISSFSGKCMDLQKLHKIAQMKMQKHKKYRSFYGISYKMQHDILNKKIIRKETNIICNSYMAKYLWKMEFTMIRINVYIYIYINVFFGSLNENFFTTEFLLIGIVIHV